MSILSSIGKFFKKLWDAIRKVIAIILLIVAVILIVWSAIVTGGATLTLLGFVLTTTQAFVIGICAVIGAFLIDSETSAEVVGKVGEAVGDAAGAVAGATAGALGGVVEGLLSNPVVIVGLVAVGGYFLLRNPPSGGTVDAAAKRVKVNPGDPDDVRVGSLSESGSMLGALYA